jgi:D-3-phosphoglycerate dehydrogenase / 2-oxoglutarate reductase
MPSRARPRIDRRALMRILTADSLDAFAVDALVGRGHDVLVDPALTADDLPEHLDGVQVLIVRSTRVTADALAAGHSLQLVIRAGAGTNTIDTDAAAAAGIFVCSVPGRNAVAVAELTLGLILASDRRIADNVAAARAGTWNKKEFSKARGLLGSSLGIVGLGDIGIAVAQRAAGFGVDLMALERAGRRGDRMDQIRALGIELVDGLDTLAARSDVLTVHVPGSAQTAGLIDAHVLGLMRDGSLLVNTSRGDVVDEAALLAEVDSGRLRAALDVYADEPSSGSAAWTSELAQHPSVVATHHIGASTEQAQRAVAEGVVDIVLGFAGGRVINCVNLATEPLGIVTLTVRHHDEVGVLARVLDRISRAGLNVEQMENRVFRGGRAAVATLSLSKPVDDELLGALCGLPQVIDVSAAAVGE